MYYNPGRPNSYANPNPMGRSYLPPSGRGVGQISNFAKAGAALAAAGSYYTQKYLNKKNRKQFKRKVGIKKILQKEKKLEKRVAKLSKLAESDMGTLVVRRRSTDALLAAVNSSNSASHVLWGSSEIETALAQCRYYDPSTPSALVTADGTTGSYQKEFLFTKCYGKVVCRNNYQVPCQVDIYICKSKEDTSLTPGTTFTNGITDVTNSLTASTNSQLYPTDSPQFNDIWAIESHVSKVLEPGQVCSVVTGKIPFFQYDPSIYDSHALLYQKKFHARVAFIRVRGVLGHDSIADQQGFLQAGIDIEIMHMFEIKYSAGADIKFIHVIDNASTFTNGGLCSNMPVADNQAYSLA